MIPLSHIKVIELAGLAPVPLCGMILSDFGAKVIRIDNAKQLLHDQVLNRGKKSVCLDLKLDKQRNIFERLVRSADVLLDPYRPGVLEHLKLSPVELQRDNPGLIIARLTGYGQPLASDSSTVGRQKRCAGHDINYIALSGVLSAIGSVDAAIPQPPLNILGDFAGGGLNCAFAVVLALLSRERTGVGQVIDVSMTHGSAYLSSFLWRSRDMLPLAWPQPEKRGSNMLDGGAPFYRCYRTSDDRFVAVGAIEPQFYGRFLEVLGVAEDEVPQLDYVNWPSYSSRFSDIFRSHTQKEWVEKANLCGDCCITPVLQPDEASEFWRESFMHIDGKAEPKPQPVFDQMRQVRDETTIRPKIGEHTREVLMQLGCSEEEISEVIASLYPRL